MRVAMLVPGLRPHDAVSNDCLGMSAELRQQGHQVAVFALHAERVDEPALDPAGLELWIQSENDVVIYHFCTGWDFALDLFRRLKSRRVVRYHNITPSGFFRGWAAGYVAACDSGRAQIRQFARIGCDLYLGDSPFNIEDFLSCGVDPSRCAVLPPFHDCEGLLGENANSARLPQTGDSPLLLMVGRIAPNKGYLELIDAVATCVECIDAGTHLLVVGKLDPNLSAYGGAVNSRIAALGMEGNVTIVDDANGSELRAAYSAATALIMLSAHEGFCVPLVEALALGTPIIAYASSAIPWTLGEAGLLWNSRDPSIVAASVARLHKDAQLRHTLRDRGRSRYDSTFSPLVLAHELGAIMTRFS